MKIRNMQIVIGFAMLSSIICSCSKNSNLNMFSTDNKENSERIIQLTTSNYGFLDSDRIIFEYSLERTDIYIYTPIEQKYKSITSSLYSGKQPAWSEFSNDIAFVSRIDDIDQVFISDLQGTYVQQVTDNDCISNSPVWFENNKLAYISYDSISTGEIVPEIYTVDLEKKKSTKLTANNFYENSMDWSQENSVFVVSIGNPQKGRHSIEIFTMDSTGKIITQLTSDENNYSPKWSPNGKDIVYKHYNNQGSCSGIMMFDFEHSINNCIEIPGIIGNAIDPSWSPDGKSIIFSSNDDGDYDIYIIDSDGTNLKKITDLPGDEKNPLWININ